MSDLAIQFPPLISFRAIGGPGFQTNVVIMNAGNEGRDQVWALERGSWDVSHAARAPVVAKQLQSFFRIAAGRANTFRFKDWTDYSALATEGVFTLLTSTTFQMYKRYTFGASTYDRKIVKPISGTIVTTGGTFASIDYTTGIATMTSGTPLTWAGQFDCKCRFDTDQMKAETIDKSGGQFIIGWSAIPIVETR